MGKPISEEVQWIIIRLSASMSQEDIAMYTGVSQRKIKDVLSTFNKDGTVKVYTRQKPHTYSSLCDDDVQVSLCYCCAQHLSQASNTAPLPDVGGITRFIP
jgi:DNA-binding transcriptional regulator LsrR (DeoR family)